MPFVFTFYSTYKKVHNSMLLSEYMYTVGKPDEIMNLEHFYYNNSYIIGKNYFLLPFWHFLVKQMFILRVTYSGV